MCKTYNAYYRYTLQIITSVQLFILCLGMAFLKLKHIRYKQNQYKRLQQRFTPYMDMEKIPFLVLESYLRLLNWYNIKLHLHTRLYSHLQDATHRCEKHGSASLSYEQ